MLWSDWWLLYSSVTRVIKNNLSCQCDHWFRWSHDQTVGGYCPHSEYSWHPTPAFGLVSSV